MASIFSLILMAVFRALSKVQESCVQQIVPAVWSSGPATACAGACVILGPLVVFVYGFDFCVQLRWLGMLFVCSFIVALSAQVFWTGAVENANNLQQVPMMKVQLTLSGEEFSGSVASGVGASARCDRGSWSISDAFGC